MIRPIFTGILGIDPGTKFTGLAIAQSPVFVPRPLGVIHHESIFSNFLKENCVIIDAIRGIKISRIVVGCISPNNFRLSLTVMDLMKACEIKDECLTFIDENFTTSVSKPFSDEREINIHAMSAYFILLRFLELDSRRTSKNEGTCFS